MYKKMFGKNDQVYFNNESEYYELLGYLAKNDGKIKLVWEDNDEQGAWAKEGRILFYKKPSQSLHAQLAYTKGVGDIVTRVNCNDFVQHIIDHHKFALGDQQDGGKIRKSVPKAYLGDFDRGLSL